MRVSESGRFLGSTEMSPCGMTFRAWNRAVLGMYEKAISYITREESIFTSALIKPYNIHVPAAHSKEKGVA